MTYKRIASLFVILLLLFSATACGKKKAAPTTTSSVDGVEKRLTDEEKKALDQKLRGPGSCKAEFTGSLQASIDGGGGSAAVSTDYWKSPTSLEEAIAEQRTSKNPGVDTRSAADRIAAGDFVLYGLNLNCYESISAPYAVTFVTSNTATRKNFPFAPGNYKLEGSALSTSNPIYATVRAGEGKSWSISSGELRIAAFDTKAIRGSFTIRAQDASGESSTDAISITGEFDMPCTGGDLCTK